MNPLQYTSNEMFSSTELIRKSKMIFDKLNKNEIEKAIILRDGKPSFLLLDFAQYEALMSEYLALKNGEQSAPVTSAKQSTSTTNKAEAKEKIEDDDLQAALKKIEEINLSDDYTDDEKQKLKEFWD